MWTTCLHAVLNANKGLCCAVYISIKMNNFIKPEKRVVNTGEMSEFSFSGQFIALHPKNNNNKKAFSQYLIAVCEPT